MNILANEQFRQGTESGTDLEHVIRRQDLSRLDDLLQGRWILQEILSEAFAGMKFVSTKRIYNTRLAHEATEYAREHGKGNEFHKVVFRKVYAEGQDPSQWDVLRSATQEVGLDPDEMQREVEAEKYMATVVDKVRWAYQIGVTGVPTYVINNRYAVVGAQPYEVFKDALEKILNQKE